jgi:hypothetical protein
MSFNYASSNELETAMKSSQILFEGGLKKANPNMKALY